MRRKFMYRKGARRLAVLVAFAALAIIPAACGSSGTSHATTTTTARSGY
jgi:hypothetical protein